jgi:phosphotransferase system HPr (HPr) family protein
MSASCEQGITLAGDLHARPAGALAVAAGRFASAVSVTAGGHTVDAKSVLGVMGLGATSGQHVTVSAAGPDAREAVAALVTVLTEATRVGGLLPQLKLHVHHGSFGIIIFTERAEVRAVVTINPANHAPFR